MNELRVQSQLALDGFRRTGGPRLVASADAVANRYFGHVPFSRLGVLGQATQVG